MYFRVIPTTIESSDLINTYSITVADLEDGGSNPQNTPFFWMISVFEWGYLV